MQGGNGNLAAIPEFIRADFAGAIQNVLIAMAVMVGVAALVALRGLQRGVQDDPETAVTDHEGQRPGDEPDAAYPTLR